MAEGLGFADRKVMAELTAKMLLEVEAVRFWAGDKPFIFTSGLASPVYTDCRRLISFPRVRQTLIDFGVATLCRDVGFEQFDAVAGGETAGIPYAAWVADRLGLPMQYVRKKPKGFGRNALIEGHLVEGQRTLLVEFENDELLRIADLPPSQDTIWQLLLEIRLSDQFTEITGQGRF